MRLQYLTLGGAAGISEIKEEARYCVTVTVEKPSVWAS